MKFDVPSSLYGDTRIKAIALFRSLTTEQAVAPVPLNPGWRVTDVAAHVCGIVDDVLHGTLDGMGTDPWTAAQVDKRTSMSLTQICDEWDGYADRIDEMATNNPDFAPRITGDLIIHVHDVQHALGLEIDQDDIATRVGAHRYAPSLQERALAQLQLGVGLELTDGHTYPPSETAAATIGLRCTSYDFLRSVTGRRSRAQVEALNWDGDPTGLLGVAWNTYGPMRQDDVTV